MRPLDQLSLECNDENTEAAIAALANLPPAIGDVTKALVQELHTCLETRSDSTEIIRRLQAALGDAPERLDTPEAVLEHLFRRRQALIKAGALESVISAMPTAWKEDGRAVFLEGVSYYDAQHKKKADQDWSGALEKLERATAALPEQAEPEAEFFACNQAFLAARNAGSAEKKTGRDPSAYWGKLPHFVSRANAALNRLEDAHKQNEQRGYLFYNMARHLLENESQPEAAHEMYVQAAQARKDYFAHLEASEQHTDAAAYADQVWKAGFDYTYFFPNRDQNTQCPVTTEDEKDIVARYAVQARFAVRKDRDAEWQRRYGNPTAES